MAHQTSPSQNPVGFYWRSSRTFAVFVISIAIFSDSYLFSFIIPILPAIFRDRMKVDPSQIQLLTSLILSMNAIVSILMGPITGYLSDKSSDKNGLMVLAWGINMVGTAITAWSISLPALFFGRLVQTIAGSFIWIVGMAIIGETVQSKDLAKVLGFVALFMTGGLLCGPAISGSLYELTSYSLTWASTFVVLVLGVVAQIIFISPSQSNIRDMEHANTDVETSTPGTQNSTDRDPLISPNRSTQSALYQSFADVQNEDTRPPSPPEANEASTIEIWRLLLSKKRVSAALVADGLFAIIIASFETTIPIHIKAVFNWETLQAGLLFLLVQAPSLILVVPAGWLKDKVGMRYPVSLGFLLLAPSLWLLGTPGYDGFGWANEGGAGRKIYIAMLLTIGVWRTLPIGLGAVEILRGAKEVQDDKPGILGRTGSFSRAFTLSNITWKLAMFVGPLVSGALNEAVGYYYLNVVLAGLCVVIAFITFVALK